MAVIVTILIFTHPPVFKVRGIEALLRASTSVLDGAVAGTDIKYYYSIK
jgi:hypothetical protein